MNGESFATRAARARHDIAALQAATVTGQVVAASGMTLSLAGLTRQTRIGDRIDLQCGPDTLRAEIVGFDDRTAFAMTYGAAAGMGAGDRAHAGLPGTAAGLRVDDTWLGRVVDPLGTPLDARGPLGSGPRHRDLRADPPAAATRARLGPRLDLGVHAIDLFATCCLGQRLGLFAGSGVGKSTLMAMLARNADCDVVVLALVGERGREVREFLDDDLGADGLARAVVVVATSDTPPLMRRDAAYAAMTIAEHFRDEGHNVLLLMDSVTRLCAALREIGLGAGQAPTTRGYPASVFTELPRLLERAGPGTHGRPGSITAFFTVLVEGDDLNEPVSDAVRGILDGHVVLDRAIADRGRFPAIDVLKSISRAVPACNSQAENALTRAARGALAVQADMQDLVRLGAYRAGTDPAVDQALVASQEIEEMLRQGKGERGGLGRGFGGWRVLLGRGKLRSSFSEEKEAKRL